MAKKEATGNTAIINIIQGISAALSKAHDGALDDDGKPIEIGLNREVDNVLTTSRQMDGFSARVQGNILIVSYQADVMMQDVHKPKFEDDVESMFNDIVKFIKKQYKAHTKKALKLTKTGKIKMKVETVSRIRTWVVARGLYKIGGLEVEDVGDQKPLEKSIYKWLEQATDKKPKNVKIKKGDNDKEED